MVRLQRHAFAQALGIVAAALTIGEAGAQAVRLPEVAPAPLPPGKQGPTEALAPELPARAWIIVPRLGAWESVTDNVLLTPSDRKTDFITTVSPGISVEGHTRRINASVDAELDVDRYVNTPSLNGRTYSLTALADAELLKDNLFFDVRSAISPQSISRGGVASAQQRTLPSNQTQVFNNTASPYLRHDFGTWAAGELRYRLSTTNFQKVSTDRGDSQLQPADTMMNRYSFDVHSGPAFSRLKWSADGSSSSTDYTGDRVVEENTVTLGTEYLFMREAGLIVQVGYDTFDDSALADDTQKDPSWRIGPHLMPSARTDLTALFGKRYGGDYYSGRLTYKISEGLLLMATHDEAVTTQQQAISEALVNATGSATDVTSGSAVNANATNFGFTPQAYTAKTTRLTVFGQRGRTSVDVSAEYQAREVGVTSLGQSGQSQAVESLVVNLRRDLTPQSDVVLRLAVSKLDSEGPQSDSIVGQAGATYEYKFNEALIGSTSYLHYDRRDDAGNGYRENILVVGAKKLF